MDCIAIGLVYAPATFQRLMHNVFDSAVDGFITVFLDDILIFSINKEEYQEHLRFVLECLRSYNFKAKLGKSAFDEYLGHIVEADTIKADSSKVRAIMDWPVPQDVMQSQSFLGLANYYNRFIRRFSHIAAPLTKLLAKNVPFVWAEEQKIAFDELKLKLTTTPVLQLPKFDFGIILETDASSFATGGALMQDKGQGLQSVSFFSKKLSDTERRYSPHEIELLEIVQAFEKFRPYVECSHTTVRTDHKPLTHFNTQPSLTNRQIRWMQKLGRSNYTVEYKIGISNIAADSLSRRPYHIVTKAKFVYFADQRGQPLVQSLEFFENSPIRTAFNHTIVPKHHTIRTSTGANIKTQCYSNFGLVRIINKYQELFIQYLKKIKRPLNLDAYMQKWVVDVSKSVEKTSEVLYTDTTLIEISHSIIGNQPQSLYHSERAVIKSDPIFGKYLLDIFEPVWDGTAFSVDPYVAKDIRDRLAKVIDTLTDCGDQFPKSFPSSSLKENLLFVESTRIFFIVFEPGWFQRIADAQVLDQSLALYKSIAQSPQSDDFEYMTLKHLKFLYRKTKVQHQLITPATGGFRELLLQKLHESKVAGHLGIKKTIQDLFERVWWPGMMKTIKDFVNTC